MWKQIDFQEHPYKSRRHELHFSLISCEVSDLADSHPDASMNSVFSQCNLNSSIYCPRELPTYLHVFGAGKGVAAGRAELEGQSPQPCSSRSITAGRAWGHWGTGTSWTGLEGFSSTIQIPQGAREGKYDGSRLLSVVPSEINRGHRQGIQLFFTSLKIPELQSMLVCKMPFVLVTWQESRAKCWTFPDWCTGGSRTAVDLWADLSLGRCHTNAAKAVTTLHCLVHLKYIALNISSYMLGHPDSERNIRMVWYIDNLLKTLKDSILFCSSAIWNTHDESWEGEITTPAVCRWTISNPCS